jgi:hypothetical protein
MANSVRLSAFLPERADKACTAVEKRAGLSRTDAVTKAVIALDTLTAAADDGGEIVIRYPDGREQLVVFL